MSYVILSSAESVGAFNTGFDTSNRHRPTKSMAALGLQLFFLAGYGKFQTTRSHFNAANLEANLVASTPCARGLHSSTFQLNQSRC